MLSFNSTSHLVQSADGLASLPLPIQTLYLDFETSSGDTKLDSLNPWHNCTPIGYVYTVDQQAEVYFIPWALAGSREHLQRLLNSCSTWVNHHIKYDAHVAINNLGGYKLPEHVKLVCTIALSHLIDADREYKGGYALDVECLHWLGIDLRPYYERLKPYTHTLTKKGYQVYNKDYGVIPLDILAEYACAQVLANRQLFYFIVNNLPPESVHTDGTTPRLLDTEIAFTRVLFNMEQAGLYIDPLEVALAEFSCLNNMVEIEAQIQTKLGYCINPNSSKDLYDLICNRYGRPVVKWTNADSDENPTQDSNPSFDKDALKEYREDIETPKELKDILDLIIAYKHEAQHRSLFYKPWQELCVPVDGLEKIRSRLAAFHAEYNQNVRTGRLSCSQPNEQQLDKIAKALIHPKPGYAFLSCDESQIEYRMMASDTGSRRIIDAYAADPDTDFHEFIRLICEIEKRRPAKNINFMMGFGGGKKKTVKMLASNYLDMGMLWTYDQLMTKATAVYNRYHREWPELKPTSQRAAEAACVNGFIRNIAGRRLHLPGPYHNVQYRLNKKTKQQEKVNRCHIAFNRRIQSGAADIAKEIAVRIQPLLYELGAELVALVHDEFLFHIPLYTHTRDEYGAVVLDYTQPLPEHVIVDNCNRIRAELEYTPFKLKICLRCNAGYSRKSWADCDSEAYSDVAGRYGGGKIERTNLWPDSITLSA